MKRVIFSLVIVLMLVMMACSHAANLLPEVQQAAGTWPRCNSGCTANDAVAVDAWIVANPDCTPGQNNTAEIWLTFGITRQKGPFCAVVVMDIYVDYFLTYDEYNITIGDLPGKGSWNYSIANITWPCGAVLELRDIYVQWMTNDQDPCGENCGDYPPSKCWMGGPLYVRAPLVADFEFDSVCFCNNTTFTDKTTGGEGFYTYDWDFGDSLGTSTEQNPIYHYASNGTYTVTLNVTDSDSPPNIDSQSYNVTVNEKPTATASSNSPVCEGATIELYGGPDGMTSYSWTGSGGWTSSLQNPTRTGATTAMAGSYTLTVTNGGCTDDKSTSVTVNTKPTATASSNSPVCEGATIELYGGPGGMTSYSWTGPNGFSSSLQSPTIPNATTLNAGTYYLTVTDGGCTSDPASTTVVVGTKPTASSSSNSPLCEGSTIVLTGGPGGMTSYSWTGPNGFSSSLQNPTIPSATTLNAGTYYLTVTDGGCTSDPASTVVVVNTKPTATASSNPPVSEGATIQLYGSPDGMTSYSWTGPGGWTSILQNPTRTGATLAMAGTYTLTVTNSNDCTDDESTSVTVNAKPTASAPYILPECMCRGLMISSTEGGSVTTPGEGELSYVVDTVVGLVASPDPGYKFINWSGDVATIADIHDASTNITMSGWYSITANFEPEEVGCNLTISSTEGGSVISTGEGTFVYEAGTVVDLLAQPEEGYQFVKWTGDVSAIADVYVTSTTIIMNADYSITANFEAISAIQYKLTLSSTTGGSVTTPGEGIFTYDEGTVVTLVSTPDPGYQFTSWLGDVDTIADVNAASITITMDDNYSITGTFRTVGGCFIATAAYGTPTAEQIDVLREFRDIVLLESTAGSQFVALYYQLSPPVADFIAGNELLRTLVRELLVDPVVWVVEATGDIWRN